LQRQIRPGSAKILLLSLFPLGPNPWETAADATSFAAFFGINSDFS
jgi:hypothetical protein